MPLPPVRSESRGLLLPCALLAGLVLAGALGGCARGDQSWPAAMFGGLRPPSPAETVREAFDPYDADLRRSAVARLAAAAYGGERQYVRLYRLLVNDNDATVRAAAAQALGLHGGVDDAERLAALLEDGRSFVRWEAAKGLQRIHNPAAVEALVQAVRHDEDTDVRMAAAEALGQYPQRRVVDVLVGALNDREYSVVHAAHGSLTTLTGADIGIDSRDWLRWTREQRGAVFADARAYRYQPYDPPTGLFARMRFWRDHAPAEPRRPVGLEDDEETS